LCANVSTAWLIAGRLMPITEASSQAESVPRWMWRRIWNGNETSIIGRFFYLFLIILCAPIVAVIGVGEILTRKIPQGRLRNAILTILILALIALLVWYACLARR